MALCWVYRVIPGKPVAIGVVGYAFRAATRARRSSEEIIMTLSPRGAFSSGAASPSQQFPPHSFPPGLGRK